MLDTQTASLRITPTLRRVLDVLSDMPGGATVKFIANDVYAKPTPERGLRCLRSAIKLGVEQGLLMVAGRVHNNPVAPRGPSAVVYTATPNGMQHMESPE